MQNEIILRQRPIPGSEAILPAAPLQTFTTDFKPVEVDLSNYTKFGQSKDFEYYKLKNEKNI